MTTQILRLQWRQGVQRSEGEGGVRYAIAAHMVHSHLELLRNCHKRLDLGFHDNVFYCRRNN